MSAHEEDGARFGFDVLLGREMEVRAARLPCPRGYVEHWIYVERGEDDVEVTIAGHLYRDGRVWCVEDVQVLRPVGLKLTEAEEQRAVEQLIDYMNDRDEEPDPPDWEDD